MKGNHSVQTGKEVRSAFPEQTRSIPAIIAWTLIFLADIALVFWLAGKLGIDILAMNWNLRSTMVMVYAAVVGLLFWVEAFAYNRIIALFR